MLIGLLFINYGYIYYHYYNPVIYIYSYITSST